MATYFITKWALTQGIVEASDCRDAPDGYISYKPAGYTFSEIFRIDGTAFSDRDKAIAAAEKMRTKKVASLKKQIAKLEKLRFGA